MTTSKIDSNGLWSVTIAPNELLTLDPAADMKLTNATFGHQIGQELTRTTLLLRYIPAGAKTEVSVALGSLLSPRIEQMCLDVTLPSGRSYTLETKGGNVLHVTGYFIVDDDGEESGQTKITKKTLRPIPKNPSTYGVIGPATPSKTKAASPKKRKPDSEEDEADEEEAEESPDRKRIKKEH